MNEAKKRAKEEYYKFFNSPVTEKANNINFDLEIAQPFFKHRIRHYRNKNPDSTQGLREQKRYENYIKKFFEDIDLNLKFDFDDLMEHFKGDELGKKQNLLDYDAVNKILRKNKILAPQLYNEKYNKNQ